ncbi:hypothetical protein PJWF_00118 [Achromobacter phage JWF]|uniref:hypothetical protein n=1 Tax=Achromobacter phage JWF TaxID=1589748 RepID=UPI000588DF25|nr:hypothetical protein AXJ13_gp001 [Achromobacter phage JWF]YP_009224123.1 hypothetical protein AXJ13_gp070 [Achromobacter phage JWF]AJD82895.1 hypothetical protein PJWF_00001 [Achromobacter phage JWF]AJD83011.1 hypothetical protein PJWF_00118 [Achromobacter phage JWF]
MSQDPLIGSYSKVISSGVSAQLQWKQDLFRRAANENRNAKLERNRMREEIRAAEKDGDFDWLDEVQAVERVRVRRKSTRKRVEVADSLVALADKLRLAWNIRDK